MLFYHIFMGTVQLYRLSLFGTLTVAQNQYMGKKYGKIALMS